MQDHLIGGGEITPVVWLDSEETADVRRFVALDRGVPMIRALSRGGGCRVDNPKAIIGAIIDIMDKNCSHGNSVVPPLVENLGQLMKDLGNAAWIVMNQSTRGIIPGSD
jgi:hypothetical protein